MTSQAQQDSLKTSTPAPCSTCNASPLTHQVLVEYLETAWSFGVSHDQATVLYHAVQPGACELPGQLHCSTVCYSFCASVWDVSSEVKCFRPCDRWMLCCLAPLSSTSLSLRTPLCMRDAASCNQATKCLIVQCVCHGNPHAA
jgi:hypothetical protein